MRITIATREDLFPAVHGAAVKVVRTAEALSRLGCEVTVATGDRLRYHRFGGGRHEFVDYPPRFVAATRVPPRLLPWLRRLGVPDYWRTVENLLDSLGYPREEHLLYRPVVDPDFWLRTLYVGWKHRSDWFQAEFPGFLAPCWVAARLLGRRCSVVEHNVEWRRLADTTELAPAAIARLRGIELQLCHLADEVVTCSDADRQILLPDGFERSEITVIPHGVDVQAFSHKRGHGIRVRYGVPSDHALLFFHGTLHYQPNTVACRVLAEEILPRLRARGRRVKALVCGMSPPARHAHPDLVYAGVVDELAAHVAAADVAVVPLQGGGGTRLKILEYMAAGKPVVSTGKGAEGLLAADGREILLAADGDWEGFCAQIERILDRPEIGIGVGALGRRFVESYDWLEVGRAFVDLYESHGTPRSTRGCDWNERLRERASATQAEDAARPVEEIGAERVAALHAELERARAKEGHGANGFPSPAVVDWTGQSVVHELDESALSAHVPGEIAWQKPRTMILLLNKRCNLRCDFCDLWHHNDMMPFEHAASIVQRAPEAGVKTLVITGGEPFVHPRIYDLIELGKNLGLGVNITTNGTLLRQDVERLRASAVDSLSISLDGAKDTHERLRGVPGCFDETLAALETLRAQTSIQLNIYFVVTNQNVRELREIYDLASARGIGFDFWPVNGYPHLYITDEADKRVYLDALDHIARTSPQVRARLDYYRYGIEYMNGRRDHFRCLGLIEQFGVNHQGKLVPCCVWDQKGLQVGSALDEPLDQLFFSRRAQKLREQIFREGCVDQCFNHSLYEFQAATGLPFVVKPAERPFVAAAAVVKESGQARGEAARQRKKAASKARRARGTGAAGRAELP